MADFTKYVTDRPNGYTWAEWSDIADLLALIDYGCEFDCDGRCQGYRDSDREDNCGRNCCHHCAAAVGFGPTFPIEALEEIEALFDDELGFWRPTGCNLPSKYKGGTCWKCQCGHNPGADWESLHRLVEQRVMAGWEEYKDRPELTLTQAYENMRNSGMLREQPLVTIS